jgi:hypothetical protein
MAPKDGPDGDRRSERLTKRPLVIARGGSIPTSNRASNRTKLGATLLGLPEPNSHARGRWFETSRAHGPESLHSGISRAVANLEPPTRDPRSGRRRVQERERVEDGEHFLRPVRLVLLSAADPMKRLVGDLHGFVLATVN